MNIKIWLPLVAIIIVIGVALTMLFNKTIDPKNVMMEHVNISTKTIELKGDLASSGESYKSYKVRYDNENLYITLKGSSLSFSKPNGQFDINLDNSYGVVKSIYLEGTDPNSVVEVYSNKQS